MSAERPIEISIITLMRFENEEDLNRYLLTDAQANATGFAAEVQQAWDTQEPYHFETPRPAYGAVTMSEIRVERI